MASAASPDEPPYVDSEVAYMRAHASVRPRFLGQRTIDAPGLVDLSALSPGCSLVVVHAALSADGVLDYTEAASHVKRDTGRSGYGQMKPRRELCYRAPDDAGAYVYSGVAHHTVAYTAHVLALVPEFRARVEALLPAPNAFRRLSHGIDIVYSREFSRGGSIAAHSDSEHDDWGLVLIFSLGQTRWLRVRHRATQRWINVEMPHNSLVAMHGAAFQRDFTHQVDKLGKNDAVYARLSLNLRFGLGAAE